jgi:ubiquinone/menaquinone biosynthesis C-methylase UbiE
MREAFSRPEAWFYETFLGEAVADVVVPLLAPHVRGRTLDVGCGGGAIARRIGAIGVDASRAEARRARGVCASAVALPFADATFDSVVSSCSIKHWPDAAAGVQEMQRVLQPGGTLVVVEMDKDSTPADVRAWASLTKVPRPFRWAYAQLDIRSVLPWALTVDELGALVGARARKVEGLPYAVAVASG